MEGISPEFGISLISGMPHFAAEGPLDGELGSVGSHAGEQSSEAATDFDQSDEGSTGADNDCHDTHPNADSRAPELEEFAPVSMN